MVHLFGHAAEEFGSTEQEIKASVASQFYDDRISEYNVLAVWSSEPDYSMSCWLLLEKGGTLYEVEGGHCSCNGYEEQFLPAECPIEYLTNGSNWSLNRIRSTDPEQWNDLLHSLGIQPRAEA
jgi:hypothetical protein